MNWMIDITAAADEPQDPGSRVVVRRGRFDNEGVANLPVHSFPGRQELTTERSELSHPFDKLRAGSVAQDATRVGHPRESGSPQDLEVCQDPELARDLEPIGSENPNCAVEDLSDSGLSWEEERERRIYRARTVTMLRRYMRYSIETGRLPSLLGREFFRSSVSPYSTVTFEDRVIFVHDMENCLNKLDDFSREILARHVLQEHDQAATARLLQCAERTVRTYAPMRWTC